MLPPPPPNRSVILEERQGKVAKRLIFRNRCEIFQLFNLILSQSIRKKGMIVTYETWFYIFHSCLEKYRHCNRSTKKMHSFEFISKYPIEALYTDFDLMRKEIILYHVKVQNILYSPRSLNSEFSLKVLENLTNVVEQYQTLPSKRSFPPKRHIGVGPRDKGNSRKDSSYDGSPSWREVPFREEENPSSRNRGPNWRQRSLLIGDSLVELRDRALRRLRKKRREESSWLI